jgi:hypothetical protein
MISVPSTKIPRSARPTWFSRLNNLRYSPDKEAGAVSVKCYWVRGARRRRRGGGPGGGCAHKPVGTYLYLHAVGAGNPVAVPGTVGG